MSLPLPRPALIRPGASHTSAGLLRVLPAWFLSAAAHGLVCLLFLLVTFSASAGVEAPIDEPLCIDVETPPPPDLSTTREGLDPEVDSGIHELDRIGDKNMPGVNLPGQPVGLAGNPDLPFVMEPPPGLGNGSGSASGIGTLAGNLDPFRGVVPPGLPGGI